MQTKVLYNVKAADSYEPLSQADAIALKAAGIEAIARYENITAEELQILLNTGLAVFFVITSPANGYTPTIMLGRQKHQAAAAHFYNLGIPVTTSVFVDLESMGGIYADQMAYAHAACDALHGFTVGIYAGCGLAMTGKELYSIPSATRYWKSGSRVTDRYGNISEPDCGWACIQDPRFNQDIGGHKYDFDYLGSDYKGRSVIGVIA